MPTETTPLLPIPLLPAGVAQITETLAYNIYKLLYLLLLLTLALLPELVTSVLPSWAVGVRIGVAIGLISLPKTYFAATTIHRVIFFLLPLVYWSIAAFPFAAALSVGLFSLGICFRNDLNILDYLDDMKEVRIPSCHLLTLPHVRGACPGYFPASISHRLPVQLLQPTINFIKTTTKDDVQAQTDPASDNETYAVQIV
ncbi:hypothetical protein GGX14DRAFT_613228 [Mycena pura]|uniref:Uncharacterized protein n=1 Tax=Mycena pura TaxID=153505 RepID=A0AAD6YT48_9AGAR|nr:hypothetical protein GGX14DRAFT_613228 [Mycena pura]